MCQTGKARLKFTTARLRLPSLTQNSPHPVGLTGLEPVTPALSAQCSNRAELQALLRTLPASTFQQRPRSPCLPGFTVRIRRGLSPKRLNTPP